MTLQQLELILAIADSGSVHGACHILNKTQPTLTKALRLLEDELGVPLFLRTSRGMTPTDLGLTVISRARVICSGTQKLREDIAQQLGATNGKVAFSVSPLVAYALMPDILSDFRKHWPNVEVSITEEMYPEALNRLREGQVDMCVGPRPLESSREFLIETLFTTRLVIVARRSANFSEHPTLAELAQLPWVLMGSPNGPGQHYVGAFHKNNIPPPQQVTWLNSFTTLLEYVQRTDCCCLLPEQLYRLLPESLGLKMIDIFGKSYSLDICLFTKADSPLPPAAEALERAIRLCGINFPPKALSKW